MTDQFQKFTDLRNEKSYAYLRWLMLISTGAFSLSVNVLFGKTYLSNSIFVLKAALTANAVGILFGAFSVYGETMLTKGAVSLVIDKEIHKLDGNYEAASRVPTIYALPSYMRLVEKLFYLSLCFSLIFWVYFIWLQ
ncbi:hypothetical protein [Ferrovum myxofaciens]|uniref:Uncharacterized protein n=1 Tax=Ferrovum myxofaciens TaxID=416213 RepID=A0A9E6MX37_9PROT|nr:hypothetical protein [Ferrovum myxofaciens]QKE37580.1 MAG: hypothetical protein HO273_01540 [Ferrovum myxofaciens]QWY75236.1 MAG: hypothetical protein JVY19_01970 [Ferrovum myxofaciens]QWY77971.1 MAG: hypothetical protein JZL65_02470 [Ferrovum myxofaciens]